MTPRQNWVICRSSSLYSDVRRFLASPVNEDKNSLESDPSGQSSGEGIVCTVCVASNPPNTNYCARCGAPLNNLVTFNPFDQTLAEGFAYRRAVDGPPNRIILIGIWLLFGPALVVAPLVIASAYQSNPALGLLGLVAERVFWVSYLVIAAVILFRATANYRRKRQVNGTGIA